MITEIKTLSNIIRKRKHVEISENSKIETIFKCRDLDVQMIHKDETRAKKIISKWNMLIESINPKIKITER